SSDQARTNARVAVACGEQPSRLGVVTLKAHPRPAHIPTVGRRVIEGSEWRRRAAGVDARRRGGPNIGAAREVRSRGRATLFRRGRTRTRELRRRLGWWLRTARD